MLDEPVQGVHEMLIETQWRHKSVDREDNGTGTAFRPQAGLAK